MKKNSYPRILGKIICKIFEKNRLYRQTLIIIFKVFADMNNSQNRDKGYLFLLGGYDLEMVTIRNILLEKGYTENIDFIDKKLSWVRVERLQGISE